MRCTVKSSLQSRLDLRTHRSLKYISNSLTRELDVYKQIQIEVHMHKEIKQQIALRK